jgi:hypothetical protein
MLGDDPVRPEISCADRLGPFGEALVLVDEQDEPMAVICVKYCQEIPITVEELLADPGGNTNAIFYSVWSYRTGTGSEMVFSAQEHIKRTRTEVSRFVTLSPRTLMARNFHLKNGASVFQENPNSVNYEYPLSLP